MIYIASDHAGFELKEKLIDFLHRVDIKVEDIGPTEYHHNDDYPDFVVPAMKKVLEHPESNRAILICKNGVGVCIAANKFRGIRCALSWDRDHAKSSREHDDSNVLALAADYIDTEDAKNILHDWMTTPFNGEERHRRRLDKLAKIQQ